MADDVKARDAVAFPVSRTARERYLFDEALFSARGNVVFRNFRDARLFAQRMNEVREAAAHPERAVSAGLLNAMALIDEIFHHVAGLYVEQKNPEVFVRALARLESECGRETVADLLVRHVEIFPPPEVHRGAAGAAAWLEGRTAGVPNRAIVLEEIVFLHLANTNPARAPFADLFDDDELARGTAYARILAALEAFFRGEPFFGPDDQSLVDMLRAPALAVPDSLFGQLEFIWKRWGYLLGSYLRRLLASLDLIKEEETKTFVGAAAPGGVGVYDFTGLDGETERFSTDRDWMPSLVLIAKNAYVWLDQLSRRHERAIDRLDAVPDEELDELREAGITGLWLIGLWERSPASRKIKQLRGNPDAVASAYSLFDYSIARDLGGEEALGRLKEKAWSRGIRLASDMVPNHVGIDARWVVEHPDWFIGASQSPFPAYTFNGPDLSWDDRVAIQIEDHYYEASDAAVVFKRTDRWTGSARYLYHGNDGTSTPWNDTAQLDYLLPEVREAVVQTILHVARLFPIIRFDAAMTLARRHFQRLWFPEPGTGGAIPSRAEHGMTRERFEELMPLEFWREVVDRAAAEAPDTLLLAEAFWMMEGFFVRTLGMHRVYNSAFMNMLRDEENAKYRSVIKNTLEFDPEVLKRYVNFMNNPDERTAVDQFGKGDKYFGICTLMATLPGLPMFGHGQIEGFTEKYGMEFRRPRLDERPDAELVARHRREIFPLLHRRRLFAEVRSFLLYDLFTPEGRVDENVFAYSNREDGRGALVLYHNRYAATRGWIRTSVAYAAKGPPADARNLVQRTLGEGLGLGYSDDRFVFFRDLKAGREHLKSSREIHEKGLYAELGAYECRVLVDFREIRDDETRRWEKLAGQIGPEGVVSLEEAMQELLLRPVQEPFRELVNAGLLRWLIQKRAVSEGDRPDRATLDDVEGRARRLLVEIGRFVGGGRDEAPIAVKIRRELRAALMLPTLEARYGSPRGKKLAAVTARIRERLADGAAAWGSLIACVLTRRLGEITSDEGAATRTLVYLDSLGFGKILDAALRDLGLSGEAAGRAVTLVRALVGLGDLGSGPRVEAGIPASGHAETGSRGESRSADARARSVVGSRGERSSVEDPVAGGSPSEDRRGAGARAAGAQTESPRADGSRAGRIAASVFADLEARRFLGVHVWEGQAYFHKESFGELLDKLLDLAAISATSDPDTAKAEVARRLVDLEEALAELRRRAESAGYRVAGLVDGSERNTPVRAGGRMPRRPQTR